MSRTNWQTAGIVVGTIASIVTLIVIATWSGSDKGETQKAASQPQPEEVIRLPYSGTFELRPEQGMVKTGLKFQRGDTITQRVVSRTSASSRPPGGCLYLFGDDRGPREVHFREYTTSGIVPGEIELQACYEKITIRVEVFPAMPRRRS